MLSPSVTLIVPIVVSTFILSRQLSLIVFSLHLAGVSGHLENYIMDHLS